MIQRRGFLAGMLALSAAPAIVRASSLMPSRVIRPAWLGWKMDDGTGMVIGNLRATATVYKSSLAGLIHIGDSWIDIRTGNAYFRSAAVIWTPV